MTLDQFVSTYNGQQLKDPWGGYLGECVSLWKREAQEVNGIPPEDLYVPEGAAKNIWFEFTPKMAKYYDKVSGPPQKGDVAVYDGNLGDVAIVINPNQVFGQLGTPIFKPAAVRNIGSPLGYLRKKGTDMAELANDGDIENVFEAVYSLRPTPGDMNFWREAIKGNYLDFKGLFYAVKDSERYAIEHFVNDGDIGNLKAKGIDASGTKGKFWKEGTYLMSGISGISRDTALDYVSKNLK